MNSLALLTHEKPSLWCPSLWDQGLHTLFLNKEFPLKHLCSQQIIVLALEPSLHVVVSLLLCQNPRTAPKTKILPPRKRQGQDSRGAGRLGTSHSLSPGDVQQERSSVAGGTAPGVLALLGFGAGVYGPGHRLSRCVPSVAPHLALGTGEPWVSHCLCVCSAGEAGGASDAEKEGKRELWCWSPACIHLSTVV